MVRTGLRSTILVITLLVTAPPAVSQVSDLTGVYTADDGGVYYVRQAGAVLWWAGMSTESDVGALDFHKGLRFTNVFHGGITGNTIDGEWADVPRGRILQSGRLTLRFSYLGNVSASFLRTSETGGFAASHWTKRIVVNSAAGCETASSTNIRCKFGRVTKNNGGTLLHGGDLVPFKDNVVVFGQVHHAPVVAYPPEGGRSFTDFFCRLDRDSDDDGDFHFDMRIERVNNSGTGLDQLVGPGFWTEGWLSGIEWAIPPVVGTPSLIRAKLDRHDNLVHPEVIMYGRTGGREIFPVFPPQSCATNPGQILLPGWMENGANSVLVNGQPVNGDVAIGAPPGRSGRILGQALPEHTRIRVTGVLVLDCGHDPCQTPSWNDVEIHPVYSIDIIQDFTGHRLASLTGVWAANDEGTYYVRQLGNAVWWLGLSRDRGGSFANVFHGMTRGNTIAGDWADVPMGFARNSGRLGLLGAGGAALTTRLAKDTRASTGPFRAILWEKLYDR